jgi:hypothetical protein
MGLEEKVFPTLVPIRQYMLLFKAKIAAYMHVDYVVFPDLPFEAIASYSAGFLLSKFSSALLVLNFVFSPLTFKYSSGFM